MKIEKHCTDLQTSKNLKEIGCPQNSLYVYRRNTGFATGPTFRDNVTRYELLNSGPITSHEDWFSAYILSELIEILGTHLSELKLEGSCEPAEVSQYLINQAARAILKLHSEGILKFNQNQE